MVCNYKPLLPALWSRWAEGSLYQAQAKQGQEQLNQGDKMRTIDKEGIIISMKLRDDLYTIGLTLKTAGFLVFDVKSIDGQWHKDSLKNVKPLLRVFAVTKLIFNHLGVERLKLDYDQAAVEAFEDYRWIDPYTYHYTPDHDGTFYDKLWLGGKLLQMDTNFDKREVINWNLKLPQDLETIEKTEMINMWSSQSLQDRLVRYFDTGINRDDMKFFVFPGLWDDIDKLRPLTRRVPIPDR